MLVACLTSLCLIDLAGVLHMSEAIEAEQLRAQEAGDEQRRAVPQAINGRVVVDARVHTRCDSRRRAQTPQIALRPSIIGLPFHKC